MFSIGDFSKIARISTRQLRHYDELGLFKPTQIDPETGYRYYSAKQLPLLNRILALKDLGLTLEQIKQMVDEDISPEQIHGMLMLKKAQVEQALHQEMERFRSIEERIWEIETDGVLNPEHVVLKSLSAQTFLSTRQVVSTIAEGFSLIHEIHHILPANIGHFGVCFHTDDFRMENLDVEMGFLLDQPFLETVPLSKGRQLTAKKLPSVEKMATLARVGIHNDSVGHYGALGTWIEAHDYQVSGAGWEVFLEPFEIGKEDETIIEIRIPVQAVPFK